MFRLVFGFTLVKRFMIGGLFDSSTVYSIDYVMRSLPVTSYF